MLWNNLRKVLCDPKGRRCAVLQTLNVSPRLLGLLRCCGHSAPDVPGKAGEALSAHLGADSCREEGSTACALS